MNSKSVVLGSAALLASFAGMTPATAHSFHRHRHYHAAHYHSAVRPVAHAGAGYGLATFYDPGPRGRGFTAAHRSLPFGTNVKVTNLNNGRSVVVRIADRGPQAWTGRDLDLSRTAARSLGMIQTGVVHVAYQVEH